VTKEQDSKALFSSGQTAVKLSGAEAADRAQCADSKAHCNQTVIKQ